LIAPACPNCESVFTIFIKEKKDKIIFKCMKCGKSFFEEKRGDKK